MSALERHDQEIKTIIKRLYNAAEKDCWKTISDLSKNLSQLMKDRNYYIKTFKQINK